MPLFSNNEINIYYELQGSGPPLLLIAGLASDTRSWQPIAPEMAEQFTLVMPDNRGVGRSSQECDTSVELMSDDCLALVSHLGLEKVNILGHSMGAMVAMNFAVRNPQMLDKLILVATSPKNSPRNNLLFSDWAAAREAGTDLAAWFRGVFSWIFTERFFDNQQIVDDAVKYLLDDPWPQSAKSFRRQIEAIAAFDITTDLSRINVPALVISGREDILFPLEASKLLARQIPAANLTVIEHAAHSIHTEQAGEFIRAVAGFLQWQK